MIEVRISLRDFIEYSTQEAKNAYVNGRLMAADVPIDSQGRLKRGEIRSWQIFDGDYYLHQWFDESELE